MKRPLIMSCIFITACAIAACTSSNSTTSSEAQGLCDYEDCGDQGSPIDVRAETIDWVGGNFPAALILSLNCFVTGGSSPGSQCHVTISQGSWTYSYGCALWTGSSTLDCAEE